MYMRVLVAEDLHQIRRFGLAPNEQSWPEEALLEALQSSLKGTYQVMVAVDETTDQVIAYAIASYVLDQADVQQILVNRCFRGQGIGKRLLQSLITELVHLGVTNVFLEVRPSNQVAVNLYCSMGFKCIQKRKDYYPGLESRREDAWVFSQAYR